MPLLDPVVFTIFSKAYPRASVLHLFCCTLGANLCLGSRQVSCAKYGWKTTVPVFPLRPIERVIVAAFQRQNTHENDTV